MYIYVYVKTNTTQNRIERGSFYAAFGFCDNFYAVPAYTVFLHKR